MTDIKVILDTESIIDIGALSAEERELFFEQLAAEVPDIPKIIIDDFRDMQTNIINDKMRDNKPELQELLLRKIVQLSQYRGSIFNINVIPIIPGFTTINIREHKGGAAPFMRARPQKQVVQEAPGAIKIRFDTNIFVVTENGIGFAVPANEEINVIGLIVNPICTAGTLDSKGNIKPLTNIVIYSEDMGKRIVSGQYMYTQLASACDNYFIRPDTSISLPMGDFITTQKILFNANMNTLPILSSIFDYLINYEQYCRSIDSAYYIYTQIKLGRHNSSAVKPALKNKLNIVTYPAQNLDSKEQKHDNILDVLETIHRGRFNSVYSISVLADIDTRGFTKIYQKSLLNGDDQSVKNDISIYKERAARILFQNSIKNKALIEQNKLNSYKLIIEKKLGIARLHDIEKQLLLKPATAIAADNILGLLKSSERKPVQLEFERQRKYLDAVLNNKCPHVKIYKKFRKENNSRYALEYFNEIKKFFKNPSDREMILCNNCGFELMCPHLRDFTEMDLSGTFHAEIKAKLTKYIDKSVARDQYYCKICGEMISSLDVLGDITISHDVTSAMNEELKNFMWGEMIVLTKYLKFGNLVNVPQLITSARDVCYPFVFEIEKQILKSKTNSADEIKAKKRLYVTIYAFAYFIHLILLNRNKGADNVISFKNFTPKSKNIIVDLVRHALELIVLSRNIAIREVGMSADVIKNTLIEAYKSVQKAGTQIVTLGESEDILVTLLLDPVYKYLYTINSLDQIIHGSKVPGASKQYDIVDKIDETLGISLAKIEKNQDIFAKALIPKFDAKWRTQKFDDIKSISDNINAADINNIVRDAYFGYVARSFENFYSKLTDRVYTEPMYVDISANKSDQTSMDVKFRKIHEQNREKYLLLESKETTLLMNMSLLFVQTYKFLRADKSRRWQDPGVFLSRIYDEDGRPHKFDIYINSDSKEIISKDISNSVEEGDKFNINIVDHKCSVCGILRSAIESLSEQKIRDSLRIKRIINNFFRFYENRCPKSGLHEFESGKCTKCGMSTTFITDTSDGNALKYYEEFSNIYVKERAEFSFIEHSTSGSKKEIPTNSYASSYDKWTFNFNIILDLANKLKINHRLLSALGAVEKQEYSDIQSGAYIPVEVEERNSTRAYLVNTHIKNLLTEYNQLKFFHRLVKPSVDLSTLIDSSGVNKHKIIELSNKLPNIFNDFNNKYEFVRQTKKPREIVDFCIQNLCEMCLIIWDDNDKETEKLRHDFVDYFVKKILRFEELLSKPGHFNWSLLYGDKDAKEKDSYDMNFNKDLDVEKRRDESDSDDEMGDTGAPLSTKSFDMEDDLDTDPGADQDNDQEWNVGEEYGLD